METPSVGWCEQKGWQAGLASQVFGDPAALAAHPFRTDACQKSPKARCPFGHYCQGRTQQHQDAASEADLSEGLPELMG